MEEAGSLNEDRSGWITTPAICFNCTEYWVAVLQPDVDGRCIYNHMECPACGDYRGVALGALLDRFRDSVQGKALEGIWREPVYPELKTEFRNRFNPKGNLGDFPPDLEIPVDKP